MIVAISGKAKNGKDTSADHLVKNRGFIRLALADPIKEGLSKMMGIPIEWFTNQDLKTKIHPYWKVSPVSMLLSIGTEWGQYDIHGHLSKYGAPQVPWGRRIWVERLLLEYNKLKENNPNINVVIPDMRFKHEADRLIKEKDVMLVRVVRINNEGSPFVEESERSRHISETELDTFNEWTHIIKANGVESLISQVDKIVPSIDTSC